MRRLGLLALLLPSLVACGGDCDRGDAVTPAATAGAEEAPRASSHRTPEQERERFAAMLDAAASPDEARVALEAERFEDPLTEGARTICLGVFTVGPANPDAITMRRACAAVIDVLAGESEATSTLSPVDAVYSGALTDDDPRVPDDDSPYDEYPIEVAAGWTVVADMRSEDFDTYLWLIGPDGSSLVQDDDGGEGTNSYFQYRVTASGRYIVRANSYDGSGRGAYTLHVLASSSPPPPPSAPPADVGVP